MLFRLEDHDPECRGMLAEDKSQGVVVISTAVASNSLAVSDLVGGVMVVVGVAAKGERWGGCKLTNDAILLLCQSARNVTVMRAMPIANWLQVRLTTTGDPDKELQRAVRIEGRVAQRSILSPSPPSGRLTGNEGALAAWAEEMAEEWADSGYLFKAVEDGGLGVTQARFRISGYLNDSGGMPAAEYQRQLAAAESWRPQMAPAVH